MKLGDTPRPLARSILHLSFSGLLYDRGWVSASETPDFLRSERQSIFLRLVGGDAVLGHPLLKDCIFVVAIWQPLATMVEMAPCKTYNLPRYPRNLRH